MHELFVTAAAAQRLPELLELARSAGIPIVPVTNRAADTLSDTVTPQGLVAVCDLLDVPVRTALDAALAVPHPLVTVLVGVADPGNAGTVIRVSDAAGAGAVLLAGDTVDPHNGKAVRASTGSVFHVPLARERDAGEVLDACRAARLTVLAADGHGELDLHDRGCRGDPGRAGRMGVRRRGARRTAGVGRAGGPPRPGAPARASGEPQPGDRSGRVPLRERRGGAVADVIRQSVCEPGA